MSEAITIVLIEHDRGQLKRPSLNAISAARQLGSPFSLLLIGHAIDQLAASCTGYGAKSVLVADDQALARPLADRYSRVIADVARSHGATAILGASSTFTKDVLPRAAAMLDAAMLTDVLSIERTADNLLFRRPTFAGNTIATVTLDSHVRVLSVRGTAFDAPEASATASSVEQIRIDRSALPDATEFISREERTSTRPDLSEARVVVAGGRPLKDKATFDRLIGGLADAMNGAVASTRAAVDTGIASNDSQVGQTGKVIAPQLYFGIGISGAIQHLAGVKDSRVIVAINKDPEAPIFQSATYGLVGDLNTIVPQLIEQLKK